MIIGLTGKMGAGKQEVSDYLVSKGFSYYRYSDVLRAEAKKMEIEGTRENLQMLGNKLREESRDNGIISKLLLKMIKGNAAVDGIRNKAEIEGMRGAKDFVLIAVDANAKLRFKRLQSRGREGDPKDFSEFKKLDDYENTGKGTQNIEECIKHADFAVKNEGSLEALKKKIDEILTYLRNNKGNNS